MKLFSPSITGFVSLALPTLANAQAYQVDGSSSSVTSGATALGGLVFMGIFLIIGLAVFVFWLLMLIDVIRRDFPNQNDKILWVVLIVILGIIGAIVYYFAGRSKGTISTTAVPQSATPVQSPPSAPPSEG